jgi:hypothetical protein
MTVPAAVACLVAVTAFAAVATMALAAGFATVTAFAVVAAFAVATFAAVSSFVAVAATFTAVAAIAFTGFSTFTAASFFAFGGLRGLGSFFARAFVGHTAAVTVHAWRLVLVEAGTASSIASAHTGKRERSAGADHEKSCGNHRGEALL